MSQVPPFFAAVRDWLYKFHKNTAGRSGILQEFTAGTFKAGPLRKDRRH
jgi:hypothetical protein